MSNAFAVAPCLCLNYDISCTNLIKNVVICFCKQNVDIRNAKWQYIEATAVVVAIIGDENVMIRRDKL